MALLKFLKGKSTDLGVKTETSKTVDGQVYFTPDDGKLYIDTANSNEVLMGENRIPINAHKVFIGRKEYKEIIGTENNATKGSFYFGEIVPTDFNIPWHIKYSITSTVEGHPNYDGYFEVHLYGAQDILKTYNVFNSHTDISSRSFSYHNLYRASTVGFANKCGHLLGIGLRDSCNPTNSSYARDFYITILELDNCKFRLYDSMNPIDNIANYKTNSLNYSGLTEINGYSNGLQETRGATNHSLTIGNYVFDGSADIIIPIYSGNYQQ